MTGLIGLAAGHPTARTLFLYSDRNGNFDIYKQGVSERNADAIVSGTDREMGAANQP